MRSGSLRNLIIAARLHRVNEIWEENCILDEEDRDIVSDDICFSLAQCDVMTEKENYQNSPRRYKTVLQNRGHRGLCRHFRDYRPR